MKSYLMCYDSRHCNKCNSLWDVCWIMGFCELLSCYATADSVEHICKLLNTVCEFEWKCKFQVKYMRVNYSICISYLDISLSLFISWLVNRNDWSFHRHQTNAQAHVFCFHFFSSFDISCSNEKSIIFAEKPKAWISNERRHFHVYYCNHFHCNLFEM